MASSTVVIPLGLMHMRPLQHWLQSRVPRRAWHTGSRRMVITPLCRRTLTPWSSMTFLRTGVPLGQVETRHGDDRRLPAGLGCRVQRARSVGAIDRPPPAQAYQLPRVDGCATRTEGATTSHAGQAHAGPVGQHNCRSVYKPPVWRSLTATNTTRPKPPPVESAGEQIPASHTYPRRPEPDSRCALSSVDASWRVATPPPRSPAHWVQFGRAQVDPFASLDTTHCLLRYPPYPLVTLMRSWSPSEMPLFLTSR
ncbi:uncharacterized protein LOC130570032 [Triplophysa rosa]|uniref:uncharacterized protein LOC130570032 n=1 Tax=Triplophysa rosa TaxID=992332 RepID=UPI0025462A56|nr:uncharacterized protein LOC130570032 [Triplophysa rosa]